MNGSKNNVGGHYQPNKKGINGNWNDIYKIRKKKLKAIVLNPKEKDMDYLNIKVFEDQPPKGMLPIHEMCKFSYEIDSLEKKV